MQTRMLFMQIKGPDGETVEGAMSPSDRAPGYWNVRMADGTEKEMHESDFPEHWKEQQRRWQAFGDRLF